MTNAPEFMEIFRGYPSHVDALKQKTVAAIMAMELIRPRPGYIAERIKLNSIICRGIVIVQSMQRYTVGEAPIWAQNSHMQE